MSAKKKDNVQFAVRIPGKLADAFEAYIEDNRLSRNLIATLLVSEYLVGHGAMANDDGTITLNGNVYGIPREAA